MVTLFDLQAKHAVMIERYKRGEHNKVMSALNSIDKELRAYLSQFKLDQLTKKEKVNIYNAVNKITSNGLSNYAHSFYDDLPDFFEYSSLDTVKILNKHYEKNYQGLSLSVALSMIKSTPLHMQGVYRGKLVSEILEGWVSGEAARVSNVVRLGIFEEKNTIDVLNEIRGTKSSNYSDGALHKAYRNGTTNVNTVIQHVDSVSTKETVCTSLGDEATVRLVAVLDNKTSLLCGSLDGREFKISVAPLPPLHPNCRSWLDFLPEIEKGRPTFFEWLSDQSEEYQVETIGMARTKLLRNGGLSPSEFARLNLNKNFEPISLKEMRQKEPEIFINAKM